MSRIAEGQVSDATIMALAGHLSVKMKEKYSHVRTESKRQAVLTRISHRFIADCGDDRQEKCWKGRHFMA